jgi:transcriptional regulator with XRE-family HTH domain
MLDKNEFGRLVKAYRKQRGWTQEDVAERWEHTNAYVSQIERGVRKLDSTIQIIRLADILDIPQEKLEAIGRGIPERKKKAEFSEQNDSAVLQMLLGPAKDVVRLSYIVWTANQKPLIEDNLRNLVMSLENALAAYCGEFTKPAQQLLAYAHQMQGRIAFDRLDYAAAGGHFSEMIDLGQELNDPDIIAVGMSYQGHLLRKRRRYDQAIRCFKATEPYASISPENTQGIRHLLMAEAYADVGQELEFMKSIEAALDIAASTRETIASMADQFTVDDVLQQQAGGFTELWQPDKALEIYKETDALPIFRPLRDLGAYSIDKGQAYLFVGDIDKGIDLSLRGMKLAEEYRSKRQIGWIERTYSRLKATSLGKDKRLDTLHEALRESKKKQEYW